MNTHVTQPLSGIASQACTLDFKRGVLRQTGSGRARAPGAKAVDENYFFGMKEAIQESIEKTFGKITEIS
jgi:hypothetical protein